MENLKLNKRKGPCGDALPAGAQSQVPENTSLKKCPPDLSDKFEYNTAGKGLQEVKEDLSGDFRDRKLDSLRLSSVYAVIDRMNGGCRLSNGVSAGIRSARVYSCGTWFEFSGPSSDDLHLTGANFCRDRLCPQCNKRRSLKIFSQTSAVMDLLQARYPDYEYVFLTLTVRNCSSEDLSDTLALLNSGWRWLYHDSGYFRKKHSYDPEPVVAGTFRSLEVKLGSDCESWHPHLHVILAVKPEYFTSSWYLTTSSWVQLWRWACDLDYDPVCYIEACSSQVGEDGTLSYRDSVAEVSKYTVKGSDYLNCDLSTSVSRVLPLLLSLHRRRLCSYTGCFAKARRDLALDDPVDGDLVDVDGIQLRDDLRKVVYVAKWRCGVYVLQGGG